MAKKTSSSRGGGTKRSSSTAKRGLVRGQKSSSYTNRTTAGRSREMDDRQPGGRPAQTKRARPATKSAGATAKEDRTQPRRKSGWRETATAYASLGLAKGLRVAAATLGRARGQASTSRKRTTD